MKTLVPRGPTRPTTLWGRDPFTALREEMNDLRTRLFGDGEEGWFTGTMVPALDMSGVDAKTGKFLWRYDHTATGAAASIATPIEDDGFIYTGTHYTGGGTVKLSADGEGVKAEEIYYDKKLPTAIGGAVIVGGYMYGTNRELTLCVNFKTGEVKWTKERAVSPASICFADGRLYLHGEKEGDVALLEATPDGYQERGHFSPPNLPEKRVGKAWQYPVVANGRLYIHDWGTLWCYDVKAPAGKRATARTSNAAKPARN